MANYESCIGANSIDTLETAVSNTQMLQPGSLVDLNLVFRK